jgi:hypothetical protein
MKWPSTGRLVCSAEAEEIVMPQAYEDAPNE